MNGLNNSPLFDKETYLSTAQVAEALHVTTRTLGLWRLNGSGPPFKRFAKRVLYKREDVNKWVESHPTFQSNAEYHQSKK